MSVFNFLQKMTGIDCFDKVQFQFIEVAGRHACGQLCVRPVGLNCMGWVQFLFKELTCHHDSVQFWMKPTGLAGIGQI